MTTTLWLILGLVLWMGLIAVLLLILQMMREPLDEMEDGPSS